MTRKCDSTVGYVGSYPLFKQSRVLKTPSRNFKPWLFRNMIGLLKNNSTTILDIGSGPGLYAKEFKDRGYRVSGIDSTPGIDQLTGGLVQEMDLTNDCSRLFGQFDWGIFIDVGEHIPKEYEQTVIDNVGRLCTTGLIVSWGEPRVRGWMHVNCRTEVYIASQFAVRGWMVDDELTIRMRWRASPYYVRCLMVLKKS